jgi:phosphoribosylaminoimidazolecarboxamide formyltransferase / IMP cyclohydrolase
MFQNALVSVSEKKGLVEFLKPLYQKGMRIVSTGGTAQHLKDNGIKIVDISEQTGFPEVMGGRVKTLHPNVHMPILSRQDHPEDFELLKKSGLAPFDLVICNLYPFEAAVEKNLQGSELIEKIDIGGPTVLRAAAKNFSQVTVVCDPEDYSWIAGKNEITLEDRKQLAAKVFAHVSSYDSLVASELGNAWGSQFSLGGHKVMELRYGENPHQQAAWYRVLADQKGLHTAEVLQGKVLSYNNLLDLDAASSLVQGFTGPAAVAVKHNNPCGAAVAEQLSLAIEQALKADPVSVFGGIIAVNREIGKAEAEMLQGIFLECIVAPSFSNEALEIFAKKKNLRILRWKALGETQMRFEMKTVAGGFLLQHKDIVGNDPEAWKFLGEKPSAAVLRDLQFGEKVCATLKSNAIALVKNGQTVGLGMGQVNRVDAVKHAIDRMQTHFGNLNQVVLASDAFFPFPDSIEVAAKAGVSWILQPGGSVKDEEVFAAAKKLGVNMVVTGTRHFKH